MVKSLLLQTLLTVTKLSSVCIGFFGVLKEMNAKQIWTKMQNLTNVMNSPIFMLLNIYPHWHTQFSILLAFFCRKLRVDICVDLLSVLVSWDKSVSGESSAVFLSTSACWAFVLSGSSQSFSEIWKSSSEPLQVNFHCSFVSFVFTVNLIDHSSCVCE